MIPSILVVQHQDDCPPALVGQWLVEEGCALDIRRPYAGDELPTDSAGHHALLVLGGSMGADDDRTHPWLTQTKQLVRDAVARRTPVLGICLGHQLVAVALGGEVRANPRGQQLGLLEMGWTDAATHDPVAGRLAATHGVFWNDDLVVRLPQGSAVLAQTSAGEVQVARLAEAAWGVQLHPEVDDRILAQWADEDRDRHGVGVIDGVLMRIAEHRLQLETHWRPLAVALAHAASADAG